MSTRAGQQRAGWERATRTTHWPRASRRLALVAFAAVCTAWVLPGTGSDSAGVAREYAFTGHSGRFVIPAGVCRVRVEEAGASGGLGGTAGSPGLGVRATATLTVEPGETLLLHVGGSGSSAVGHTPGRGGWNGGGDGGAAVVGNAGSGGGGASDVRRASGHPDPRLLVAAGGSGGGGGAIGGPPGTGGGNGNAASGDDGYAPFGSANPATGGQGGSQSAGGAPGRNAPDRGVTATAGGLGAGGAGASGDVNGGGGGGGGLYGGGGGGAEFQWATTHLGAGHGGGGSSFGPPETAYRTGGWGNLGDGWIKISYDPATDRCVDTAQDT